MKGQKRNMKIGRKAAPVIAGGILVFFLSFLLVVNYRSQIKLQKTSLSQLVQTLDKQATIISYFYLERKIDLNNLARARAINIFFENKALGMSMAYGLKASLVQVGKQFDALIKEKKISKTPVYERIVFIDTSGNLLVDRRHGSDCHDCTLSWKDFLTPKESKAIVLPHRANKHIDVMVSTPYFFKGQFKGQVIAWVNTGSFSQSLMKAGNSQKRIFIDFDKDFSKDDTGFFFPEPGSLPIRQIRAAKIMEPFRFKLQDLEAGSLDFFAVRIPISETSFFMVTILPVSDVIGYAKLSYLLIAMLVLAVIVIGAAALLWNMNARELVLQTRLEEEGLRKNEIEAKNIQLEAHIQVRNQLEQTLKESEEKFRNMSLAAQDAIIMIDNDGCISFWNQAAADIFGYSYKEAMNQIYYTIMAPEYNQKLHQEEYEKFRKTGKGDLIGKTVELVVKRKTGDHFPAEISLSAIKLGGKWNAIGIIRDISLRKENEAELEKHRENLELLVKERTKELEQAQKELINKAIDSGRAQLSAMILHNIGNAITPVSINTEKLKNNDFKKTNQYLLECYNDLTKQKDNLTEYVTKNTRGIQVSKYMGSLIESLESQRFQIDTITDKIAAGIEYVAQILSLQSAYAPGKKETKEKVNLNLLVEDALKIQESTISKSNIVLEKSLLSGISRFLTDKNKLMQVIINLIKNSCDAIDENPRVKTDEKAHMISVSTYQAGGKIGLKLSDTGCGVEKERLKEIFDFGISSKGSSGFGLYYCKSFIETASGTLTLESQGAGKGSTVFVEFPVTCGNKK